MIVSRMGDLELIKATRINWELDVLTIGVVFLVNRNLLYKIPEEC